MDWASIPSPGISSINIGPLPLHFYGMAILASALIGLWLAQKRLNVRGIDKEFLYDFALIVLPCGFIAARIYHVLSTLPYYLERDWWHVFAIWEGGIGIFGGITGAVISAYFVCRWKKVSFTLTLDAFAPALILAQGIGRIGNYFNQELFGLPTDLPWGLEISDSIATATHCTLTEYCAAGQLYHPAFLYEMIWDIAGCGLLLLLEKKLRDRLLRGQLFAIYIMYYAIGRFFIEMIRINYSTYILGLRINDWTALAAAFAGFLLFAYLQKRNQN